MLANGRAAIIAVAQYFAEPGDLAQAEAQREAAVAGLRAYCPSRWR